jgi:hypothetical protein
LRHNGAKDLRNVVPPFVSPVKVTAAQGANVSALPGATHAGVHCNMIRLRRTSVLLDSRIRGNDKQYSSCRIQSGIQSIDGALQARLIS